MKFAVWTSALSAVALALTAGAARADIIDFDEFSSPPVTGFYADTGVTGPLVYAHATIQDGAGAGSVMNGDGWLAEQTSGFNLFGTESSSMDFLFNTGISGLNFDLINGIAAATFTVHLFDAGATEIGTHSFDLSDFGEIGSVSHLSFAEAGVWRASITGNDDFAVDTIGFSTGVPEPATWTLMIGGFGLAGAGLRRRGRAVAA